MKAGKCSIADVPVIKPEVMTALCVRAALRRSPAVCCCRQAHMCNLYKQLICHLLQAILLRNDTSSRKLGFTVNPKASQNSYASNLFRHCNLQCRHWSLNCGKMEKIFMCVISLYSHKKLSRSKSLKCEASPCKPHVDNMRRNEPAGLAIPMHSLLMMNS